mmetsp:Transcript_51611/g.149875  ORF Transcript_51611/g.149875 Transcript_51611/m.149875 type:complete len:253 (+) Transcript_51611:1594-2352(+)
MYAGGALPVDLLADNRCTSSVLARTARPSAAVGGGGTSSSSSSTTSSAIAAATLSVMSLMSVGRRLMVGEPGVLAIDEEDLDLLRARRRTQLGESDREAAAASSAPAPASAGAPLWLPGLSSRSMSTSFSRRRSCTSSFNTAKLSRSSSTSASVHGWWRGLASVSVGRRPLRARCGCSRSAAFSSWAAPAHPSMRSSGFGSTTLASCSSGRTGAGCSGIGAAGASGLATSAAASSFAMAAASAFGICSAMKA